MVSGPGSTLALASISTINVSSSSGSRSSMMIKKIHVRVDPGLNSRYLDGGRLKSKFSEEI